MAVANWSEADSNHAQRIWSEYQQHRDVSQRAGQTAGIEAVSGSVWFGDSIQDVVAQRDADRITAPLYFVRVGSETYYRKDAFLVDFPFDGQTVRAEATFARGNDLLIGTGMLRDYRLAVDFPAGTVVIEKS
jgi:hypothetical protein